MDPITTGLTALAGALLEAAMGVVVAEGIEEQALRRETQNAQMAAIDQTINSAKDAEVARLIIVSLGESIKQETREAFAAELKKTLLLSDQPNVEALVNLCVSHWRFRRGVNPTLPELDRQTMTEVLLSLVENLRLHLLEQPTYRQLYTNSEILRAARQHLSVSEQQLDVQQQQLETQKQILDALKSKNIDSRLDFYAHVNHPPANYVARKELLAKIVSQITSRNAEPLVFHGMGGIGKSVIARAICEDDRVQEYFSDGILFLELGKNPNIVQILADLIEHLGGTSHSNSPSVAVLKNSLAKLLADRKFLLILDNAWTYSDVEIFNVIGRDSRIFITTRQGIIAERIGVSLIPCPGMNLSEGLELITKWSGHRQGDSDESKQDILEKLGFHPLAIKLAGAQLARRPSQTSEDWLSKFNVRILELEPIETVGDSLKLTFELSLELLSDTKRLLYRRLSAFTEDKNIPSKVMLGLWQRAGSIQEIEARNTLFDLASMALIDIVEDRDMQTIRLHPLLRDFLRDELDDKELETTHHEIVEYYRHSQQGDGWTTVVEDGYYYEYLAYHLVGAGMATELYALLLDSPAWWEAKLAHSGHLSNYVDDINIAISTFSEPITIEDLTILVQLYAAREAVQRATARYWDEELQAMVWLQRKEEALRIAWLRSDPKERFNAVLAIQHALEEQGEPTMEVTQMIALAKDIHVVQHKVDAILTLAEFYSDKLNNREIDRLFDITLEIARGEPTSYQRLHDIAQVIRSLIPLGKIDNARDVLSTMLTNKSELYTGGLSLVAHVLELATTLEFSKEVIEDLCEYIIANLSDANPDTFPSLCSRLIKANYTEQAETIVNRIQEPYWRIVTLGNMAVACHELHREASADIYFTRAFHELQKMSQEPFDLDSAAHMLVGDLARGERFHQATNLVYNIRYLHWRSLALTSLIYYLARAGLVVEARQQYLMRGNIAVEKRARVQLCLQAARKGLSEFSKELLERKPARILLDETDLNLTNKINSAIYLLIEQNRLDQAVRMAELIPNPHRRIQTLARIAFAYLSLQNESDAKRLCEIAGNITQSYDDFMYVEGLAWLMLVWFGLEDHGRAKKLYEQALDLALGLSTQHGRCSALASIIKFAYLTRNSDGELWTDALSHFYNENNCANDILRELATLIDIKDDRQFIQHVVTQVSGEDFYGAWILEGFAERAIEANDYELLDTVLSRLVQYSSLEGDFRYMYSESLARVVTRRGDFEKALVISETILPNESRASIQAHIAAAMLREGLEANARQVFAKAEALASSIQTYSQWRHSLAKWSASLFQQGYHLEALRVYQPDQILDYTEIANDWENELNNLSERLAGDLLLKIVKIYAWVDTEWATVFQYLTETS